MEITLRRDPLSRIPNSLLAAALTALALAVAFTLPVEDPHISAPPARAAAAHPARLGQPAPSDVKVPLAQYIAQRWQIGNAAARRVVALAWQAAHKQAVDPLLVLAVVAEESAFKFTGNAGDLEVRPRGVDPLRPHGLMQVSGQAHAEKMPVGSDGRIRVTSDRENLLAGSLILGEYLRREQGDLVRALQRYNGSLKDKSGRYAHSVLRLRAELQHAANIVS